MGTEEDLESISENDVPLVICPRANSILNDGIPPIEEALDKGVELWMGRTMYRYVLHRYFENYPSLGLC